MATTDVMMNSKVNKKKQATSSPFWTHSANFGAPTRLTQLDFERDKVPTHSVFLRTGRFDLKRPDELDASINKLHPEKIWDDF
jgi:hypothetical protein